jgi:hypothetical protein
LNIATRRRNPDIVKVFSYLALDPNKPNDKSPVLNLCRKDLSGHGYRVVIPMELAWQFVEDNSLIERAIEFAGVLYQ